MKPTIISLSIAAALAATNTQADNSIQLAVNQHPIVLDPIVVSASQEAEKTSDVAGTVNVINADDIEKKVSTSIKDALKYTPSVSTSGGRKGDKNINIRGIDGNRVLIAVDGVRQAKNLEWGSTNSSRVTVDVNTLKQIEVVPSPGSTLYGSDAMGGSMYLITKEPADIFSEDGDGFGGSNRVSIDSSNSSVSETFSLAGRSGDLEGMVILTVRDREETKTHGGNGGTGESREKADPSDGRDKSVLTKFNYALSDNQLLKFTAERMSSLDDTTELSSSNDDATFSDKSTRTRFSGEYELAQQTPVFDLMTVKLDWQKTNTDQHQYYYNLMFGGDYTYDGNYDETVKSLDLRFKKFIEGNAVEHALQYGVDLEKILFEQQRTSSLSGTNRSMPRSELDSYAFFVQDQISFVNTGWSLIPGLRFDAYEINPQPDAEYLASSPSDPAPDKNKDQQLSFKLGTTFDVNDNITLFAQYAQGFKAPDMDQMFANYGRAGAYQILSNADLKPETSDNIELGFRYNDDTRSFEAVAFYNDYENFIEEVTLPFDATYPWGVTQQQNLSDVVIKGIELKGSMALSTLSDTLDGFTARGAVAYADGEYKQDGDSFALNSISPVTAVVGVAYDAPTGDWGSEATLLAAAGKEEDDVDDSSLFLPGGYGVIDLTGYYNVTDNIRIDAGVFNVTDKKYWDWNSVRTFNNTHTGLARFSEPGRNFRLALNVDF